MFKLYEKDKSMTVQLDLQNAGIKNIVPGTILFDDTNGVRPGTTGDTITAATAGKYYISVDYYDNTMITSHATSKIPPSASSVQGSGKIAAVPIVENFTATVHTDKIETAKGTELTITNGKFAAATQYDLVIAVATAPNGNTSAALDDVPTPISTFILRYAKA